MTAEPRPGKLAPSPRHPYGPRAIGAVLPAVTRTAFRSLGPASAQLVADWPGIVGPALAGVTAPLRLVAGTLTLGCNGPMALELQHLSAQLIERINTHLGRPVVQRLRFLQRPDRPTSAPGPTREPLAPIPIDGMPDGPLRDALGALGAEVRAKRA